MFCCLNGIGMVVSILLRVIPDIMVLPIKFWEIFILCTGATLVLELGIFMWCLGIDKLQESCCKFMRAASSSVSTLLVMSQNPEAIKLKSLMNRVGCRHSWRYHQLTLLFAAILAFGIEIDPSVVVIEVWVGRTIILLLLVLSRDQPSSFEGLQAGGAGYGL
eukprot:scaffold144752_cov45-Prasinocladus_malaysianus.AAC.1